MYKGQKEKKAEAGEIIESGEDMSKLLNDYFQFLPEKIRTPYQ